jgi:hypothetical protein
VLGASRVSFWRKAQMDLDTVSIREAVSASPVFADGKAEFSIVAE